MVIRALLLQLHGDSAGAIEVLRRCLERYPYASDVWGNLALFLLKDQKYSEALEATDKASNWVQKWNAFNVMNIRLNCLLNLKRTAEARNTLADLERVFPERAARELTKERVLLSALSK